MNPSWTPNPPTNPSIYNQSIHQWINHSQESHHITPTNQATNQIKASTNELKQQPFSNEATTCQQNCFITSTSSTKSTNANINQTKHSNLSGNHLTHASNKTDLNKTHWTIPNPSSTWNNYNIQSMNQSTSQPIDQATNYPTNQQINTPTHQSTTQAIKQTTPFITSTVWKIMLPIFPTASKHEWTNQSINQPFNHCTVYTMIAY